MAEQLIEFRLFGGVAADRAGTPVDLGHARQRCVLAVLLVDANTAVSVDELIDRVWAGEPPLRAKESLQSYLTRLRRALPEVRITRIGGGYVLAVDKHAVDLHRFRELAAAARKTGDPAEFEQAVALWQGDPLAGLDVPWAHTLRAALTQERTAVELDLVDAQLGHGKHHEVLPTLAARVEQHPLDERLAGQYLLALYRAGRQADALRHYERVRATLAEELGIDPGPGLRAVHQHLLTGEAAPIPAAPVAPVPRQLPASPSSFSGRGRELDRLTATLDQAEPGRTVIISAVGGTGGIGKTWLAVHWAHQHTDRFPDGQLFVNLRGFDPSGKPTSPQDAIRGFLDALGVESSAIPVAFDAQTALYRSLVADQRMLIVLDNAADTAQVVPLLPGSPLCTVVVTSRDRMIGLVNAHGAQPLPLDALPENEARALLAGRLGTARLDREPDAVDALITCCAGLPLALSIVASRALEHPGFPLAELAAELQEATDRLAALDEEPTLSVRSVLSWSYAALTEEHATVFALLGLAPGPDISLPAAANLADLPETRIRSVLRSLERVSLVQQHVPGRYRMHDLVRLYAEEQSASMPADVRDAATDRLRDFYLYTAIEADALIAVGRQPVDIGAPVPGCHPLPLADAQSARAWLRTEYACLRASQVAASDAGRHRAVWLFAWALVSHHARSALLWEDIDSWQRALVAGENLDDTTILLRSDRAMGEAYYRVGLIAQAQEHLYRSLSATRSTGDELSEARTHESLSFVLGMIGEIDRAIEHGAEGLRLVKQLGLPEFVGSLQNMLGFQLARAGRFDEALTQCVAAYESTKLSADKELAAESLDSLGYIALHTGQHDLALDYYREALAVCREISSAFGEVEVLKNLGSAYRAAGDPAAARSTWTEAVELCRSQGRAKDAESFVGLLTTLGQ
ncbi:MAG TPA: BTAD domain-containing putative transcriptional regulator [Pseudonocardiaceae bacterium]